MKLNLPNKLTLLRMLMMPFIMLAMLPLNFWPAQVEFVKSSNGQIVALVLFCLASFTDFLDGRIARKYNIVTNFGKFTDPLADKLLVLSVFLAFVASGRIHALVLFVILSRELVVTGLRQLGLEQNKVIAASYWGKAKTTVQIFALISLFLEGILSARGIDLQMGPINLQLISDILVGVSVLLAFISGVDYFIKNKHLLAETEA